MDASWNIFGATLGKKVLHTFAGGADGGIPSLGTPLLLPNGNIFGLAQTVGTYGYGVVFENIP
jgi:hypothetical protein